MLTTIIVVTGSGPGALQRVVELDLPAVPLPGEHLDFGGRKYRTLERSWRIEEVPVTGAHADISTLGVAVGLLVEQIAGPPHVITNSGGEAPN